MLWVDVAVYSIELRSLFTPAWYFFFYFSLFSLPFTFFHLIPLFTTTTTTTTTSQLSLRQQQHFQAVLLLEWHNLRSYVLSFASIATNTNKRQPTRLRLLLFLHRPWTASDLRPKTMWKKTTSKDGSWVSQVIVNNMLQHLSMQTITGLKVVYYP